MSKYGKQNNVSVATFIFTIVCIRCAIFVYFISLYIVQYMHKIKYLNVGKWQKTNHKICAVYFDIIKNASYILDFIFEPI